MVDATVDHHLEVLRMSASWHRRIIERVHHRHAVDRLLRNAVEYVRERHADGFVDGRRDVDDVVEVRADSSPLLDPAGHDTASGLRTPPRCEAICLVHWNGVSIAHAQPAGK